MSAVEAAFKPAKESVSWAEEAVAELNAATAAWLRGDIAEIVTEFDTQSGENVRKLRLREGPPGALRRKATEALVTTRHAFDQATFAARNLISGPPKKRSTNFPWSANPTDLVRLLKEKGIDERLWDVFAAHHPYPRSETYAGGNDVLRTLATMANDKHTVGLSVTADIVSTSSPPIIGRYVQSLTMLNPEWDPVKNEAELVRWIGDVDIEGDYEFGFQVILQDARLPQTVNAATGLSGFARKAKLVIEHLQARCAQLNAHAAAP
ncbi:hypothetical protein ASE61_06425 [Bosea sp. Root670]|uniref:hypothetical protein n=1 Tax=Bosea sp. Root670 TaxID=1736583 RepID=UPI000713EF22|nr:hypothetical protein [Bosea sp. Root670]KRE04565.1 hypothetical protein ASE61_06425 [Bosea sp. Root670]